MLRHVFSEAAGTLVAAATAAPVRGLLVAITPVVSTAPVAAAAALRLLLGTVSVVATPVASAASTIACCQQTSVLIQVVAGTRWL